MKKKLLLMTFACFAFMVQGIYAQDIIVKRSSGEEILAKVLEVSSGQVKYKKFDNLGGPNWSMSSADVFMIKYENGSKTRFEKDPSTGKITIRYSAAETQATPTTSTTSTTPTTSTTSTTSASPTSSASPTTQPVQVKQADNGVFEMLGFDGRSVNFRAMLETPFSAVSLRSGDRSLKASSISNTKGNIVFAGGATARPGSSLLLDNATGMKLQKDAEVKCDFENIPEGFTPKSIVFLTDEKSAPMSYDLASGIWIKPKLSGGSTSTASPSDEPYSAKSGEYDIVELIENNIIEVEISGGDITYVNLRIRRLVPYPVNVLVPVGSFFVSENKSAQNMVATGEKKVRLATGNWQNVSMPAACANRPKDVPGSSDKFGVQRSPSQEELARLMPALNKSGAGATVKQAAVWIITDNADYDDLGILVNSPGNVRAIGPEAAARAMKICADAGIGVTAKNIWKDRETIASKLPAGELKNWLKNFDAPKPAETSSSDTQTPDETQTAQTQKNVIKTVKLDLNGTSCNVEVGEPVNDEEGRPSVTVYSTAISGAFMTRYMSEQTPVVACAVLDDGKIIDPILVGGTGYTVKGTKPLVKQSSTGSGSGGGGWQPVSKSTINSLTYSFQVSQAIRKIIIGTYADYAKSNYNAFVSVELKENPSGGGSGNSGFIADENDARVKSSAWEDKNFTVETDAYRFTVRPPFPHQITGVNDNHVQTAIGFMLIKEAVGDNRVINMADAKAGMAWLYKAAKQDNIDGIMMLAGLYAANENLRNIDESERWYRRAVQLGNSEAQKFLDNVLSGKYDGITFTLTNGYSMNMKKL
jgi:hypothetical protein